MDVECPHCHMAYNSDDIAHTLKRGHFKCPVCGKKIPSPLAVHGESTPPAPTGKYLVSAFLLLGIVAAFAAIYYLFTSADKTPPAVTAVAPPVTLPGSGHSPAQAIAPPAPPVPSSLPAPLVPSASPAPPKPEAALPTPKPQVSDKMQIVARIAAQFQKSHSYTLEGDFVCLDMAIDVWNQLVTNGIEAKIMGGNIEEYVSAWNYRQLVWKGNHAWVVAKLSPTEKVAIETTAGVVIVPGMKNASAYFKGIEFDNPGQIKRFDYLRRQAIEVCRDADRLTNDWNENVAGKKRLSEETIAQQSRIEQRRQDCESILNNIEEFKSRAIYY